MKEICTDAVMRHAKRIFFVGIGGISMSSLAFVCRERGYEVSGSDRAASPMTEKLKNAGISVVHEHRRENIEWADAVVYTGAISSENPELSAASERGIPLIYRADLLGYLMRDYTHRIGVAGMHGKSTTTSMLSHLFLKSGKEPTVLSGAETEEMGGAYTIGKNEYFIFEACEYKDSFLCFFPTISVILGTDLDHTDYFSGGMTQIRDSFARYAKLPFASDCALPAVVACADDTEMCGALREIPTLITFGIQEKADYTATNIDLSEGRARFDVLKSGAFFAHIELSVFGAHHVYNALATVAVGDLLGISREEIVSALGDFSGLKRRFEYKCSVNGARVYIDYAHHPREIEATLRAARAMTKGRVLCFFEPHTYSRTAALFDRFVTCFSDADRTYFLDIYAARERNTSGVSSMRLAEEMPHASYISSYEEAARLVLTEALPGDTVMILGAGTIDRVADMLCQNE